MNSRIRSFVSLAILCGFVLFSQLAYAQQNLSSEQKGFSPAPIEKELSFLLGKWETKVRIYPNELSANREEVKGSGVAEYRLFGKVLEGSRSSQSSLGTYEEKEFILYSEASKVYDIISINSKGFATERTLKKAGDVYTIEYKGEQAKAGPPEEAGKTTGPKEIEYTVRGKYKIISKTELEYTSEIDFGNSGFKPFVEVLMKRVH